MKTRVIMPREDVETSKTSYKEVNKGLTYTQAKLEAERCLQCVHQPCVSGCPVNIDIPGFIKKITEDKIDDALHIILDKNALPSVCGRVCPQEIQCEAKCVYAKTNQPIAIGYLERFVGDHGHVSIEQSKNNNGKIAVVGGGPAGIACANALALEDVEVTIFDTWDKCGGVLYYGIPNFRLPNKVIEKESKRLLERGVTFEKNIIIGVSMPLESLFDQGYQAIFLATGAGLPSLPKISNSDAIGVFSANEYLTRLNVFAANQQDHATPLYQGKKVLVIGGGNVAMDAARSAIRQQAEVTIVYRRLQKDMPARLEEVEHAISEGVIIKERLSPINILSDSLGYVKAVEFEQNKVDGVDDKGRSIIVKDNDAPLVTIEADMVLIAVGTKPNRLLSKYKDKIKTDKYGCIVVDENMQTTMTNVFAGGDAVLGAATVILALGQGQKAAKHILSSLNKTCKI